MGKWQYACTDTATGLTTDYYVWCDYSNRPPAEWTENVRQTTIYKFMVDILDGRINPTPGSHFSSNPKFIQLFTGASGAKEPTHVPTQADNACCAQLLD
ncbi:hypothetical protein LTR56_025181 [Elasticomyces elasticus]|nr:hypothetical protein LTR56_025181 [Elasticomyces elasticus]KAK3621062.1 hypothetical protein LTR22_025347 [Elasticomyces elasticus]KAK4904536.1 hypothetical protein LTR49_026035 [Elasticomyces elasticus]KAK5740840.1 hypothetical protein LTS12_024815 [Elasticomyces elasticus]